MVQHPQEHTERRAAVVKMRVLFPLTLTHSHGLCEDKPRKGAQLVRARWPSRGAWIGTCQAGHLLAYQRKPRNPTGTASPLGFLLHGKGCIQVYDRLAVVLAPASPHRCASAQGSISVNETLELPALKQTRTIKSIQMFKAPVQHAVQGDRVGICVTQLDAALVERGLACTPGTVPTFRGAIAAVEKIRFYAGAGTGRGWIPVAGLGLTRRIGMCFSQGFPYLDRAPVSRVSPTRACDGEPPTRPGAQPGQVPRVGGALDRDGGDGLLRHRRRRGAVEGRGAGGHDRQSQRHGSVGDAHGLRHGP